MNRSFVIAEPVADVPRISDTTPLSPTLTDDAFVMPVMTGATSAELNSTHLVPPAPTQNTTIANPDYSRSILKSTSLFIPSAMMQTGQNTACQKSAGNGKRDF